MEAITFLFVLQVFQFDMFDSQGKRFDLSSFFFFWRSFSLFCRRSTGEGNRLLLSCSFVVYVLWSTLVSSHTLVFCAFLANGCPISECAAQQSQFISIALRAFVTISPYTVAPTKKAGKTPKQKLMLLLQQQQHQQRQWTEEMNSSKQQNGERSLIKLMMISGNEDKAKPQLAYVCCTNSSKSNNNRGCRTAMHSNLPVNGAQIPETATATRTSALQWKRQKWPNGEDHILQPWEVPLFAAGTSSSCPLIGCLALLSTISPWLMFRVFSANNNEKPTGKYRQTDTSRGTNRIHLPQSTQI